MASHLKPSDFLELDYSTDVLLEPGFAIALVADAGFSRACEAGFDGYFDEMFRYSSEGKDEFVDRFYTTEEVEAELIEMVTDAFERCGESLVWCAGSALGWLSALALAQYEEAKQGLSLLGVLVQQSGDQPGQKKD